MSGSYKPVSNPSCNQGEVSASSSPGGYSSTDNSMSPVSTDPRLYSNLPPAYRSGSGRSGHSDESSGSGPRAHRAGSGNSSESAYSVDHGGKASTTNLLFQQQAGDRHIQQGMSSRAQGPRPPPQGVPDPLSRSAHGPHAGMTMVNVRGGQELGPFPQATGVMPRGGQVTTAQPRANVGPPMGGQLRPKISNHHLSQAANSAHRPGISSSPNGAQHLHGGVGARYPSSYTSSLGDHSRINYRVFNNPIFDDSKEPEDDDWLHNPDPVKDAKADHSIGGCSRRGFLNVSVLLLISVCCICLFAGYPIITHFVTIPASKKGGFGLGGTNGSGQVPFLPYIASLVDPDTSRDARAWKSPYSNDNYHLVFSDEFNVEGRTFWPGDDPYWTAIDLQYAATGDYEWYSPEAINTTGGNLVISLEEHELHNLNFRSGMLQSWNKFCFQGGYLEISAVLPGSHNSKSFWPGLWTMGNLGRPGFRGSSQGMWPYSYNSCDVGILPNQTYLDKSGPDKAIHAQGEFNKGDISYLEGMRMPSCTCDGEDHAGPNVKVGRSAPELDVLEAATYKGQGQASQSLQIAPFSTDYKSDQTKSALHRKTSFFNPYTGGVYQQSVSGVSNIPDDGYELTGNAFHTFGFEYEPDWKGDGSGWVTWYMDGSPTWTVTGAAIGPDSQVEIGQRLIPVEPMSIIINLAISDGFQQIDWTTMSFPAQLKVDYVRVYQRDGEKERISCDPPDHPTSDYIERHLDIYYNENYTIYPQEKYGWPKNKLTASC